MGAPSTLRVIRKDVALTRVSPTFAGFRIYYESIKRELKIKPISESRNDIKLDMLI
jgi:hypothetical protein